MRKRVTIIPERQAFFANDDSTGMKLARVPMLELPKMAHISVITPRARQAVYLSRLEFDYCADVRLELSDV